MEIVFAYGKCIVLVLSPSRGCWDLLASETERIATQ